MKSVKFMPRGPGIYIDGSDKTYFNNDMYFRHAICKDVTTTNENEKKYEKMYLTMTI